MTSEDVTPEGISKDVTNERDQKDDIVKSVGKPQWHNGPSIDVIKNL